MNLPAESEINVHGSLDERTAVEHFLGKSVAEAELLFRENSAYYQEDLMWMGPRAFSYYIPAAVRYLESEDARGDAQLVSALYDIISFRADTDPEGFAPALDPVREGLAYVIGAFDKFEVDRSIYGDLLTRYRELAAALGPPGRA